MTMPMIDSKALLAKYDREAIDDRVLGRRLARIREDAMLGRAELASMTLIPEDELADYETGAIPLGLTRMRQIAAALDTDPVTLLCWLVFPVS